MIIILSFYKGRTVMFNQKQFNKYLCFNLKIVKMMKSNPILQVNVEKLWLTAKFVGKLQFYHHFMQNKLLMFSHRNTTIFNIYCPTFGYRHVDLPFKNRYIIEIKLNYNCSCLTAFCKKVTQNVKINIFLLFTHATHQGCTFLLYDVKK